MMCDERLGMIRKKKLEEETHEMIENGGLIFARKLRFPTEIVRAESARKDFLTPILSHHQR